MDRGPAALLLALTLTLLAGLMALAPSAEAAPLFVQNEALDRHLIFQDFSFFMPYESDQYRILGERAAALKRLGVSDIWFAPPYRAFDAAYREGYAVEDRYDLGQFPQGPGGTIPTKYGTAAELEAAIASVHGQGIRAEADLVPNQLIGLSTPEIVHATAVDQYGNPTEPGFQDRLAEAYSRGGGMGQRAYGLIKEWDAELLNGTSAQNLGADRVLVDAEGIPYRYFGPDDPRNHLPTFLEGSEAEKGNALNNVDGYLTAEGYYAVSGVGGPYVKYRPLLLYYVDPRPDATKETYLQYARAHGFTGVTDEEVRAKIIAATNEEVATLTNGYLAAQPGYSAASDPKSGIERFDGPNVGNIGKNVLQYEFLTGTDIDNALPEVQAEQRHWEEFLLDRGR